MLKTSVGMVRVKGGSCRDCEGKAETQEGLGTVEGNRQGNHSLLMGILSPWVKGAVGVLGGKRQVRMASQSRMTAQTRVVHPNLVF